MYIYMCVCVYMYIYIYKLYLFDWFLDSKLNRQGKAKCALFRSKRKLKETGNLGAIHQEI